MRICPQCRLITSDNSTCQECGHSPYGAKASETPTTTSRVADHMQYLCLFTGTMFSLSLLAVFTMTPGNRLIPALAAGFFTAGVIADVFLLKLIFQAAALIKESQRWLMGALLTFPFGTLVFAWLLARRLRVG